MSRVAAACVFSCVVVVVGVSGCLVGEVSDIPCGKDGQCPTSHFCDVPNAVCVPATDVDGAPDLDVVGVEDGAGALQIDPFVVPGEETTLTLHIENRGKRAAFDVDLDLTQLVCMNLRFDETDVPETIDAGATVEVPFVVDPDGCSTPSIQDWFLFYSGRAKRGTFNINVERAPPSEDD